MMRDAIENIGGSLVQHGPENDRIYLMHRHRFIEEFKGPACCEDVLEEKIRELV